MEREAGAAMELERLLELVEDGVGVGATFIQLNPSFIQLLSNFFP